MNLPQYVSLDEVKRVCSDLKLKDWTTIKEPSVSLEEAEIIFTHVKSDGLSIEIEEFRKGLEIELEHGTMFPDFNVTNNHPILTAKIVMAHFMETPDYYRLLDVAELQGDLLKALQSGNIEKARTKYRKLADAQVALGKSESSKLS